MTAAALAQEVSALVSLPDAVVRLLELIDDPHSGNSEIAEVVLHDPGLAASILKLVNSAYYGFSSKIGSVSHAINLIGRNELRNVAMAAGMAEAFKDIPPNLVDMHTFWFNSVTCATIARLLAERCGYPQEALFIPGLLHAIGRLVLYIRRPEQYREVLAVSGDRSEREINAAEARVFGFDHAELGAELARQWKLPSRLQTILKYHLHPQDAPDYQNEVAILHIAADMAAGITPSTQVERYAKDYTPAFIPEFWRELGQSEEWIPEILQRATLQGFEILDIVNPRAATIL